MLDNLKQFIITHIDQRTDAVKRRYPDILEQIITYTQFLPPTATIRQRYYHIINNVNTIPACKNCSHPVAWNQSVQQYRTYCSRQCKDTARDVINKRKQTCRERYGGNAPAASEVVRQKMKTTLLDRWGDLGLKSQSIRTKHETTCLHNHGVKNPSQSELIKQKKEHTSLAHWGETHHWKTPEGKEKRKRSWIERWGVDNPKKSLVIQQKSKNTCLEIYGTENPLSCPKIQEKQKTTLLQRHGRKHIKKFNIEPKLFESSQHEREISQFLHNYGIQIINNQHNIIPPLELDLFLPEHNLAIEHNGLFWHSDRNVDKQYHKLKWLKCREQGIRLITIYEDEWENQQGLVQNKLLHILGLSAEPKIYARKCQVISLTTKQKMEFLEQYHIQGAGKGSVSYGLVYNNKLISVATFINQHETYLLNRYATSCHVVGGFGKLLEHFKRTHFWNRIITYADRRWSEGHLYEKTGFVLTKIIPPTYEYVYKDKRYHRSLFMRKYLKLRLGENFDPNLTEFENTDRANVYRIWNCGLKKYELIKY